ncbi:MAG TPA: hypothetical protein PKE64_26605 [Anaerolineae bacterium]|nr:hypothetical protein [Anaerolineae bacterium]
MTKPIVDGFEKKAGVEVIRLDMLSRVGREAASSYGVWLVPAVVLFDGQGQKVTQQLGALNLSELTDS